MTQLNLPGDEFALATTATAGRSPTAAIRHLSDIYDVYASYYNGPIHVSAGYAAENGSIGGVTVDPTGGGTGGAPVTLFPGTSFSAPSSATLDNDLGAVWAWQSGFGSGADILAQLTDAFGLPIGQPITVTNLPNGQMSPRVTALDGGGFVIAFDTLVNNQFAGVNAVVFDATGTALGNPFPLAETTGFGQLLGALAPLPGGNFIATWDTVEDQQIFDTEAYGRIFTATGTPVGSQFKLNTTSAGEQSHIDVASFEQGFIASWTSNSTTGSQVLARRFDAAGNPLSGEILVDSTTTGQYIATSTAIAGDGFFVTVYQHDLQSANEIVARGFAPDGTALDIPVVVSSGGTGFRSLNADSAVPLPANRIFLTYDVPTLIPGIPAEARARIIELPDDIDETLNAPAGGGTLNGRGGNDTLNGNAGVDTLGGDDGNDTIIGCGGADALFGGEGNDFIGGDGSGLPGVDGADWLEGGGGNDWISGGDGNDRLDGGSGNDVLEGQGGSDTMIGGAGDDVFVVDDALDGVFENEGEGNDTVYASVSRTIDAHVETLVLVGGAAIDGFGSEANNALIGNDAVNLLFGYGAEDWIEGRGGNDGLVGGAGHDRLEGGDGDDVLEGGLGFDVLLGGNGADTFRFLSAADSDFTNGVDFIHGFETGIDKVVIARQSAADSFALTVIGGSTALTVDFGGDGSTDMAIGLANVTNVTAGDVILG